MWIPNESPFIWYIFCCIRCTIAVCVKVKGMYVHFFLNRSQISHSSFSVRTYECVYVCRNAATASLTQRTDLKFCENVLNQPVLCRFFQIFDISPNLAVNEKNWFFRWDTFKGWKMTKIDQFFFNVLELCLAWSVLQISKIRELWRHQILG